MPGKKAGGIKENGYIGMAVNGRQYYAHRLAWVYMTGKWPKSQVDHVNRDRTDNRWKNLREAVQQQNAANMIRPDRGLPKGVHAPKSREKMEKRYVAMIHVNGKTKYLGSFHSPSEGSRAYIKAAKEYFGEFANGGHR